ncbi:MAG TPA: DUF2397 family protein, partial [Actinomycetes bacterium]|nr:DUF2397 family protein [Actinomycetes bacterium]
FYRTRYLYQLSAEGEAAELALAAYDEALGNRGELQSVALEDIRVRLPSLRQQAELPDPGPSRSPQPAARCPPCSTGSPPTRPRS